MPYGTVNADLMTTSDGVSSAGLYGFKNRLINADMRIDQRNAGASVTAGTATYTLDRWAGNNSVSSKYTVQQNAASATPPVGFTNYLGVTSSSAYSVLTADYFLVSQAIEGLNCSDLAWGTANAAPVTLSFWVRSSLTGTFGGSIRNSAANRSYPFTYTINSANTWEKETITIAGDTSGTWLTTNGIGILLSFSLGAGATFSSTSGAWAAGNFTSATGATSVVGTNGATFYITGVQLEKGSTATSFDYLDYGRSLMQCQRYYEVLYADSGTNGLLGNLYSGTTYYTVWHYKQNKRATPTVALASGASWLTGTPTIYAGISNSSFGLSGSTFYSSATAGNPTLTASSEL